MKINKSNSLGNSANMLSKHLDMSSIQKHGNGAMALMCGENVSIRKMESMLSHTYGKGRMVPRCINQPRMLYVH